MIIFFSLTINSGMADQDKCTVLHKYFKRENGIGVIVTELCSRPKFAEVRGVPYCSFCYEAFMRPNIYDSDDDEEEAYNAKP